MRLIFAGTPPFAAAALNALIDSGHELALVLTQPDRPAGRGMQLKQSAVAAAALAHRLEVLKPVSLNPQKSPEAAPAIDCIQSVSADAMVVAAYGLILPSTVLQIPRLGCLNIHASLLPRWRGAAPIQRALEAGDAETGISIMQMERGLDTGPVLLETRIPIESHDTSATLLEKLTQRGASAIVDALARIQYLTATPQAEEGVTYANKISRDEAVVDWSEGAIQIERRMRAFDPYPGLETSILSERVKLWNGRVLDAVEWSLDGKVNGGATAGRILRVAPEGIDIACGEQALRITVVQRSGGARITVKEWLSTSSGRNVVAALQAGTVIYCGSSPNHHA
jgi:methionyl-tRNA formyltransferase